MADLIECFFTGLATHPGPLMPEKFTATLRFDLTQDGKVVEHWYVTINRGEISVSQDDRNADVMTTVERETYERIITGEIGIVAAIFSNQVQVEGDVALLVTFKRFYRSPPGTRDPRRVAAQRRWA